MREPFFPRFARRACGLVPLVLPAMVSVADAQVGLSSPVAAVTLIANVPPRAAVRQIDPPVVAGRTGGWLSASVRVQIEANTDCRLVVRGTDESAARVWVRGTDGEFRLLEPGTQVIVAQEQNLSGEWVIEVQYRIEEDDGRPGELSLPVRYEVAIVPTL